MFFNMHFNYQRTNISSSRSHNLGSQQFHFTRHCSASHFNFAIISPPPPLNITSHHVNKNIYSESMLALVIYVCHQYICDISEGLLQNLYSILHFLSTFTYKCTLFCFILHTNTETCIAIYIKEGSSVMATFLCV